MDRDKKSERPSEMDAVFTTIVGGRPPGSGTQIGNVPRGIEVLVKKASVDPEFRTLLLQKRANAAREIDLELTEAERSMLASIPAEQLEKIIDNAKVRPEQQKIFMGRAAKLMLAAVTSAAVMSMTCSEPVTLGISPDRARKIQMESNLNPGDANNVNDPNKTDDGLKQTDPEQTNPE